MKRGLFIFMLLLASPAFADVDECTLQPESLKPALRDDAPAHTFNIDKDGQGLIETATMKDGVKVTFSAGGCEHYAFSYKFENIRGGVPKKPDDPFALPLKLLEGLPHSEDSNADILVRALKEKQESGHAAFDEYNKTDLPCGDAFCTLALDPEAITIDYDFAL